MNGVYTTAELAESIIVDLNTMQKQLIDGQYIQYCTIVSQIGQKLILLRDGVKKDIDSKNKTIEELKQQLRNAGVELKDITPEEFVAECAKGGVVDGAT